MGSAVFPSSAITDLGDGASNIGCSGNGWRVIAAGDGDDNVLVDGATVLIINGQREGLGDGFAGCQLIDGAIGNGIGPADLASAIAGGVVGNRWGQDTENGAGCC